MRRTILTGAFLAILFSGCIREREVILPHTYDIFPVSEGHTRIMYVADTTFSTAGINEPVVDQFYRQLVIGDTTQDLNGRLLSRVETYRSPISLGTDFDFTFDRLWAQYVAPRSETFYFAETIAENQRTLALRFPVYPGLVWDGNQFNNADEQDFTYQNVDTTVTVGGATFENCVMVLRDFRQNFISDIYSYEIYAPNVGLIKKYDRILIFDQSTGGSGTGFNSAASSIHYEEIVSWTN